MTKKRKTYKETQSKKEKEKNVKKKKRPTKRKTKRRKNRWKELFLTFIYSLLIVYFWCFYIGIYICDCF